MKICEIFDTNLDVEWQQNGRFELAAFVYGETYVIQLEKKKIPKLTELNGAKLAEASFYRSGMEGENASFTTTKQAIDVPVRIYDVVLNAVSGKIDEYDAFIFTAETKHCRTAEEFSTKKDIYSAIADRIAKRMHNIFYYERLTENSAEFLITKIELSEETQNKTNFKNPRAEAIKALKLKPAILYPKS
jgi:hypothetical protein